MRARRVCSSFTAKTGAHSDARSPLITGCGNRTQHRHGQCTTNNRSKTSAHVRLVKKNSRKLSSSKKGCEEGSFGPNGRTPAWSRVCDRAGRELCGAGVLQCHSL
jgi:hypothetical protein